MCTLRVSTMRLHASRMGTQAEQEQRNKKVQVHHAGSIIINSWNVEKPSELWICCPTERRFSSFKAFLFLSLPRSLSLTHWICALLLLQSDTTSSNRTVLLHVINKLYRKSQLRLWFFTINIFKALILCFGQMCAPSLFQFIYRFNAMHASIARTSKQESKQTERIQWHRTGRPSHTICSLELSVCTIQFQLRTFLVWLFHFCILSRLLFASKYLHIR